MPYNAAHMKPWVKIAVACFMAVLLATFGINNIGGDTWISASAPLPAGFQRDPHGFVHQRETARLVPIIIVVALAVVSLLHGYLNRPAENDAAGAEDNKDANVTTVPYHRDTDTLLR